MEEEQTRTAERAAKAEARKVRNETEAGNVKRLRASYLEISGSEAFQDILSKVTKFAAMNTQIARDGVAYEERPDGSQAIVHLTNDQRLDKLARSAGQEEILDYINRQIVVK